MPLTYLSLSNRLKLVAGRCDTACKACKDDMGTTWDVSSLSGRKPRTRPHAARYISLRFNSDTAILPDIYIVPRAVSPYKTPFKRGLDL